MERKWILAGVVLVLASTSWAGLIPNGDFSDGTSDWFINASAIGDGVASYAVTGPGNVFSVECVNSYVMENGIWEVEQRDSYGQYFSTVAAAQPDFGGALKASAGDTALQFDAAMTYVDSREPAAVSDGTQVTVMLTWFNMNTFSFGSISQSVTDSAWQTYTIALPQEILGDIENVDFALNVQVTSSLNYFSQAGEDAETKTVTVNAVFDNFTFGVPEPASLTLLLLGGAGLLRRRK